VIVGGLEGEADLMRVRELVRRHGLEPRTEMTGTLPQAQVAREMARARVVVVPFLKSGMTERHTSPIKAFEAMAAGRPIVISDLPSSREFMRQEDNALLVPPGDPAALAAGINRLLGDTARAERLARSAWDEAPRYSWDARGRSLHDLMDGIR
jgi:glycosyltransferase involved in cell wall biosynthesis